MRDKWTQNTSIVTCCKSRLLQYINGVKPNEHTGHRVNEGLESHKPIEGVKPLKGWSYKESEGKKPKKALSHKVSERRKANDGLDLRSSWKAKSKIKPGNNESHTEDRYRLGQLTSGVVYSCIIVVPSHIF